MYNCPDRVQFAPAADAACYWPKGLLMIVQQVACGECNSSPLMTDAESTGLGLVLLHGTAAASKSSTQ